MMDVGIIGGGPAGSALAIELGRRGVKVLLLEKARHPRPKACGEGLLPQGVAVLREMGLMEGALAQGFPRVRGLKFKSPGGRTAACDFRDSFGLVVRRDRFDPWLFGIAAATPNVEVRENAIVRDPSEVDARIIVGADGLHSIFHDRAVFRGRRSNRVGQSAHVRLDLEDRVEIRFLADGELYMAPSGPGEALVASLGQAYIPLRRRFPDAEFVTPVLSRAPLGLVLKRVVHKNVLLIGDAAGAPDPITGEGLSLALASARIAARVIAERRPLEEYERERLAMGANAHRFGRILRGLSGRPRLADRVIGKFHRDPELARALVDVAEGRRPAAELTFFEMMKLAV